MTHLDKILQDAIKGIDNKPGDIDRAIETMIKNGALPVGEAEFL